MTHVIKRRGVRQYESFSREKLYHSIVTACLAVRVSEGSAEVAAEAVCKAVENWLRHRPEVTREDIRRVAGKTLDIHNPDAAYYYTGHKHIV